MTSGADRDLTREPCPLRIVVDLGGAFGMGAVGGFLWHFVRGARNSPRGERLAGALHVARTRSFIMGGNFAAWGGSFSVFDCTLQWLRGGRQDSWNAIGAGFLTGGTLALRGGIYTAGRNALVGAGLLAIIEIVSEVMSRKMLVTPRKQFEKEKAMMEHMRNSRPVSDSSNQTTEANSNEQLSIEGQPSNSNQSPPWATIYGVGTADNHHLATH